MSVTEAETIESAAQDLADVPLDEIAVSDDEYAQIMRRVTGDNPGTDTKVCAFNSSI